ncbi:metal ion binding protein [[Candida] boidinii]|nr:metal ion binding protein [[Candida] boidinii]
MKFAKLFQQTLNEENLPQDWLDHAIQYKALKKRINKVVDELNNIGIQSDQLKFHYNISKNENTLSPYLILNVNVNIENLLVSKLNELDYKYEINELITEKIVEIDNDDEEEEDDSNNDNVNIHLRKSMLIYSNDDSDNESYKCASSVLQYDTASITSNITCLSDNSIEKKKSFEIKIYLHEDTKFFQTLYEEIEGLTELRKQQEIEIIKKIESIANIVSKNGDPKKRKTDLFIWREIFQLYIETEIFFSTFEKSAGERNIKQSRQKYDEYLIKMNELKLSSKFKHSSSNIALQNFNDLNANLLKISNFQILNSIALTKILKKFDKQTFLNSKEIFPVVLANSNDVVELNKSVTKDLCYIIASRLLNLIPQIDDYTCPICCSVAFKPIKLDCGHVFCVRCLIKLQRKNDDRCPLCRGNVVLKADENNLDVSRMNYLKLYFPKETKQKQEENETEVLKEQFGTLYDENSKCIIM